MILSIFLISLYILLWLYQGIIFISILISWIPSAFNTKLGMSIYNVSNWYMKPFRGWIELGIFDFTPIIGIAIYQFLLQCLLGFI